MDVVLSFALDRNDGTKEVEGSLAYYRKPGLPGQYWTGTGSGGPLENDNVNGQDQDKKVRVG